ncbi:MAG TPA: DUF2232 domain-containing protein [Firmicutes bacterium]|nr:DUF2232 domain-containing protein [Bacillota bacterium]
MKTKSLTEGAMLAVLTVLLTVVSEYFVFVVFIVPVPLVLLVYRHGLKMGIITAFAAAAVTGLVTGQILSGISIIIFGVLGVALGMALREKFSFSKTLIAGVLASLVITGLSVLLYFLLFGRGLFSEMSEAFALAGEQAKQAWESLGVSGDALVKYEQALEMAPVLLNWGLPAFLLMSAVIMTYVNMAAVRLILRRLGEEIPWVPPFVQWRIPPYYSLFLLGGLLLAKTAEIFLLPPFIQAVSLNLYLIFFPVYLILGTAVVWHYFRENNVSRFLRILFVFLIFFLQPLALILVFLGVLDGFLDFRKLQI